MRLMRPPLSYMVFLLRCTQPKVCICISAGFLLFYVVFSLLCWHCRAQEWAKLEVRGKEAQIFRDEFGVPHIKAPDAATLFETFGYVVAQDRLAQLELSRREARGEMAELFGPDMLASDIASRRESYSEDELLTQFASLRQETQELIEAYVRGVNRWCKESTEKGLLLWEFKQWGIEPVLWKPTDCLAVMITAGRRFGEFGGKELENVEELRKLGKDEFDKKYPINDPSAPTTALHFLPHKNGYVAYNFGQTETDNVDVKVKSWVGLPGSLGSYAVLVTPKKSASGKAMLLGCPQMGLNGPQPGYEIDLHGGGFDVAGMTFPGVPIVLIGRNKDIAWTVTSGLSDNVDVYIEELDPSDFTKYLYQRKWLKLEAREEVFKVKGQESHRETFYRSIHGPIFKREGGSALSHKRTFWGRELDALGVFLSINRARYLEDFARVVEDIPLSYNLFCITFTGDIGYWHAGLYRMLPAGADPRLPLSGTGLEEWRAFVPKDWLPRGVNPQSGLLINWNNKPSEDWPNGDNVPWVGKHRVENIFAVLKTEKLRFEDLKSTPQKIDSHGTYQQVVELGGEAVNILPPGESGTTMEEGVPHPHSNDQKDLFEDWQYKPFYFFTE